MNKLWCFLAVFFLVSCSPGRSSAPPNPVAVPPPVMEPSGPSDQPAAQPITPQAPPTATDAAPPKPIAASNLPESGEQLVAEMDLDGNGSPERIYLSSSALVRVVDQSDKPLFQYQMPSKQLARVQVHAVDDHQLLVHMSWSWCLRGYPNNLFAWYDKAAGQFVTDRAPDSDVWRCGAYEHQGGGLFKIDMRNEELSYVTQVKWQDGQLLTVSHETRLLYAEADRLDVVLNALVENDVVNPDAVFAAPDVYEQFKAKVQKGLHFQADQSGADSAVFKASMNGKVVNTLSVTFRVEGRFRNNILITGVKWSN